MDKKYKIILSVVLGTLIVGIVVWLGLAYTKTYDLLVSNISSNSFSVTYYTKKKVPTEFVVVKGESKLPIVFNFSKTDKWYDDRDMKASEYMEENRDLESKKSSVVLTDQNLHSGTVYSEDEVVTVFIGRYGVYYNTGTLYPNMRVALEDLETPNPYYGAIVDLAGDENLTVLENVGNDEMLVNLQILNLLDPYFQAQYTTYTNESGNYYFDTANIYTSTGETLAQYEERNDLVQYDIRVRFTDDSGKKWELKTDSLNTQPILDAYLLDPEEVKDGFILDDDIVFVGQFGTEGNWFTRLFGNIQNVFFGATAAVEGKPGLVSCKEPFRCVVYDSVKRRNVPVDNKLCDEAIRRCGGSLSASVTVRGIDGTVIPVEESSYTRTQTGEFPKTCNGKTIKDNSYEEMCTTKKSGKTCYVHLDEAYSGLVCKDVNGVLKMVDPVALIIPTTPPVTVDTIYCWDKKGKPIVVTNISDCDLTVSDLGPGINATGKKIVQCPSSVAGPEGGSREDAAFEYFKLFFTSFAESSLKPSFAGKWVVDQSSCYSGTNPSTPPDNNPLKCCANPKGNSFYANDSRKCDNNRIISQSVCSANLLGREVELVAGEWSLKDATAGEIGWCLTETGTFATNGSPIYQMKANVKKIECKGDWSATKKWGDMAEGVLCNGILISRDSACGGGSGNQDPAGICLHKSGNDSGQEIFYAIEVNQSEIETEECVNGTWSADSSYKVNTPYYLCNGKYQDSTCPKDELVICLVSSGTDGTIVAQNVKKQMLKQFV